MRQRSCFSTELDLLQFEAEKFVDGLLGIGAAGGKSSSSEGAMLASRLETLRKERAERAPVIKQKEQEPVGAGAPSMASSRGRSTPSRNNSKRKNRRKKGKK